MRQLPPVGFCCEKIANSDLRSSAWVAYRDVRPKNSIVPPVTGGHVHLRSRWRDTLERTVIRTLGVERGGVELQQTDELSVGCFENGRGWRGRPA